MNSFITLSKHEIIQRPGIKFCTNLWPRMGKIFKTRAQKYSAAIKLVPKGENYLSYCTAQPQLIAWQKCACENNYVTTNERRADRNLIIMQSANGAANCFSVATGQQSSLCICIRAEANDPWTTLNIYFLDCFHYAILICARRSGV